MEVMTKYGSRKTAPLQKSIVITGCARITWWMFDASPRERIEPQHDSNSAISSAYLLFWLWFFRLNFVPVTVFLKMSSHRAAISELHRQGRRQCDVVHLLRHFLHSNRFKELGHEGYLPWRGRNHVISTPLIRKTPKREQFRIWRSPWEKSPMLSVSASHQCIE